LTGAPFRWPVRVYYEDTDAAGIVYYANYLKFMERARTEWLRSHGLEPSRLARETGVVFVVTAVDARYRRPARLDDALEVETRISRIGRASLHMEQRVLRTDEVLCAAALRIGCLDSVGLKPRALPPTLLPELRRED
jgi:acyl-CoA thioester hydrolase